jgi:hypothetical protein
MNARDDPTFAAECARNALEYAAAAPLWASDAADCMINALEDPTLAAECARNALEYAAAAAL